MQNFLVAVLILTGTALGSFPIDGKADIAIPAQRGEFPWMVWLEVASSPYCGGVILNANQILTAAHCCGLGAWHYAVHAGDHNRPYYDGSEQIGRVSRVVTHPHYNAKTMGNDVCILNLAFTLHFNDYVFPANLSGPGTIPSGNLVVAGWGRNYQALHKITVPFVPEEACRNVLQDSFRHGMICAGNFGGAECQLESGAPLHEGNALVGISSWGVGCSRPGFPGIYSDIGFYSGWIKSVN